MTTKQKHTPGPWTSEQWDYPNANQPHKELIISNRQNRIAVLDWDEGQSNPYTILHEEALANAALIASAPELLEALRYASELIETARQYFPKSIKHSDTFQLNNVCATVNKAIHKATGAA